MRLFTPFLAFAMAVPAATLSDATFFDNDWSTQVVSQAGISFTIHFDSRELIGGDPGSYRSEGHHFVADSSPDSRYSLFHRYGAQTLVLSSTLASLTYSFSAITDFNGDSVDYAPALEQGGAVYHAVPFFVVNQATWTPYASAALTAADFCRATMTAVAGSTTWDCTQHPDFSLGAANIQVGYVVSNALTGAGALRRWQTGLDNFLVETDGGATSAPEPASLTLVLVAAGAGALRIRSAAGSGKSARRSTCS